MEREVSDLSMDRKECGKCGAVWINGQHYWATGAEGNELDLAGLVCNKHGDSQCINPCAGQEGGQTWASRMGAFDSFMKEMGKGDKD